MENNGVSGAEWVPYKAGAVTNCLGYTQEEWALIVWARSSFPKTPPEGCDDAAFAAAVRTRRIVMRHLLAAAKLSSAREPFVLPDLLDILRTLHTTYAR